jgi:hypothetical protein
LPEDYILTKVNKTIAADYQGEGFFWDNIDTNSFHTVALGFQAFTSLHISRIKKWNGKGEMWFIASQSPCDKQSKKKAEGWYWETEN